MKRQLLTAALLAPLVTLLLICMAFEIAIAVAIHTDPEFRAMMQLQAQDAR